MIIIITGASGVGKTTILKKLAKDQVEKALIYHFDYIGIPDWSTIKDAKKWQRDTTYTWIDKLVDIARKKKVNIVFEGSTDIQFIKEGFLRNQFGNYRIVLFDCSTEIMKERLSGRGQPELYTSDMVNWLNKLRADAIAEDIDIVKTDKFSVDQICKMLTKKLAANDL